MALLSHKTDEPVGDASLEKWESVAQGGFGHVYKARHKDLGVDVAIKTLHGGKGHFMTLQNEAIYMDMASFDFVVRRYGTYQGCPPGVTSTQQGLVMEFMENGSVESLLKDLSGPPPWPLVCRLAHQVALGMNFLHSRKIVHRDLKPNNVLLNDDLKAKLADFGLSSVSASTLNSNRETMAGTGGTFKYMPPEAFDVSYEANRSFDIYSYGILLWAIINGKEPYPCAAFDLVEMKIPSGQRPCCEEIDQMREEGLKELVELMKRCWDGNPLKRPLFQNCLEVTETVVSKHKKGIRDAVGQVLTTLEQRRSKSSTSDQSTATSACNVPHQPPEQPNDTVDNVLLTTTERPPIQSFRTLKAAPPTKNWTGVRVSPPSYEVTVVRPEETLSNQMKKLLEVELKRAQLVELKRVQQSAVDVTLDPDTAHPNLILSDDGKQVKTGDVKKNLPDNPERCNACIIVLAKQSFSSGRFYYEVQVKGKTGWTLGVARESINRKVNITLTPQKGFWMICLRNENQYYALPDPPVRLSLKSRPQKVGVFVDYEEGLVSFHDVDAAALIYSFTGCCFTEKLYPYFSPCPNDGGKNSAPLIISPVNHTE